MNAWILAVILAAVLGGSGQVALKIGADKLDLLVTGIGVGLYGIATVIYFLALRKLPLSVAYPLISISYIVALIGAAAVLGEKITWVKTAGILLILAGVTLIAH
jgi:small multidrug resistance pump